MVVMMMTLFPTYTQGKLLPKLGGIINHLNPLDTHPDLPPLMVDRVVRAAGPDPPNFL